MPERLIGAVLKTVERSRVPWVRIPPPPYKKQIDIRLICFLFCVCEDLKPPSCGLRERAEAEVLLPKIENQQAKHGIAVKRERARHESHLLLIKSR